MYDISMDWSGDLQLSPTGDLALIQGPQLGTERVLRRLMTNPGDYVWHSDYGAGLGAFVGYPADGTSIQSLVTAQMQLESAVAQVPEPVVSVQVNVTGELYLQIRYADAETAETTTLSINV